MAVLPRGLLWSGDFTLGLNWAEADGFVGPGPRGDGDDGGLTNIDFVPSTNLPPRGGPSSSGGFANVICEGDEGPAPADCV